MFYSNAYAKLLAPGLCCDALPSSRTLDSLKYSLMVSATSVCETMAPEFVKSKTIRKIMDRRFVTSKSIREIMALKFVKRKSIHETKALESVESQSIPETKALKFVKSKSILQTEPLRFVKSKSSLETKAARFVKSKEQVHLLTHFLCIPITTTHSKPQLEQSLHQFRNDPSTSEISSDAYRPLQTLHIPIRALSLPTVGRERAACHLLRGIDIDGLLRRPTTGPPKAKRGVGEVQQEPLSINAWSTTPTSSTEPRPPSLAITLSGVHSKSTPKWGTLNRVLHTLCTDSTSRLGPFLDEIRQSFDDAGFGIARLTQTKSEHVTLLKNVHAFKGPREYILDHAQAGKFRRAPARRFETKDITQKFENFLFAENIKLERLSLCRLGLGKKLGRFGEETQLPEVCSVPLP